MKKTRKRLAILPNNHEMKKLHHHPVLQGVFILSLVLFLRLDVVFRDAFANGFDGYYYANQVASLLSKGSLALPDGSWVFGFLSLPALLGVDVILSIKIVVVIFSALTSLGMLILLRQQLGRPFLALGVAVLFSLSYTQFYYSFEILKNGIGLCFLLYFLIFLPRLGKHLGHSLLALGFFVLTFFTHKLTGGFALLFLGLHTVAGGWVNRKGLMKWISQFRWFLAVGLGVLLLGMIALVLLGYSPLRLVDLQNFMSELDLINGIDKFTQLYTQMRTLTVLGEFYFFHLIPLVFLGLWVVWHRRNSLEPKNGIWVFALFLAHVLLVAPLYHFTFDSIGYRFMILSGFSSYLLFGYSVKFMLDLWPKAPWRLLAVGLLVYCTWTVSYTKSFLHRRVYPSIGDMNEAIEAIKQLPPDAVVIAHAGMNTALRYYTGRIATHFVPDVLDARYFRLVYGVPTLELRLLAKLLNAPDPVDTGHSYVLVQEKVFKAFRRKKGAAYKPLRSWKNPVEKRPAHVYSPF